MARPTARFLLLFLLLALAALTGCARDRATLEAGARFGLAAATLATAAEAELLEIRREVIDLRADRRGLQAAAGSVTVAAAGGGTGAAVAVPGPSDAGVEAEAAESRLRAMRSLGSFGRLLVAAGAEPGGEDAAARLADSLRARGLLGSSEAAEARAGAVAGLAEAVTRHTLASRRAAAVERALIETEAPLRDLVVALRADFDPEQRRWISALTNEQVEAQLLAERLETADVPQARQSRALAARAAEAHSESLRASERVRTASDALLLSHERLLAQLLADEEPTLDEVNAFLEEAERLTLTLHVLRGSD